MSVTATPPWWQAWEAEAGAAMTCDLQDHWTLGEGR